MPPRGRLSPFGDIFGYHNLGRGYIPASGWQRPGMLLKLFQCISQIPIELSSFKCQQCQELFTCPRAFHLTEPLHFPEEHDFYFTSFWALASKSAIYYDHVSPLLSFLSYLFQSLDFSQGLLFFMFCLILKSNIWPLDHPLLQACGLHMPTVKGKYLLILSVNF